jgi:hypothetical protein
MYRQGDDDALPRGRALAHAVMAEMTASQHEWAFGISIHGWTMMPTQEGVRRERKSKRASERAQQSKTPVKQQQEGDRIKTLDRFD